MKWYPVKVFWAEDNIVTDQIEDAIRGISPENALKNAYWNWPDADMIELIEEES